VAAAAIKARDVGIPLDLQVLVYPVLDSTAGTTYKLRFRDRYPDFAGQPDFGATAFDRIKFIWEQYAQQPAQRTLPYASPMHAVSLHSVAPAVVVTAEHDILRGEAERYVERLRADGVPATLYEFPGQIHGFVQMRGVLSDAHRAMDLIAGSIRDALHHATDPSPKE
jgi:acetyl esterase